MNPQAGVAVAWGHGVLLAALPWLVSWRPAWVPMAVVLAALTVAVSWRDPSLERVPMVVSAASAVAFLSWDGGWNVLALWSVLALVIVVAFSLAWPRTNARWLTLAGAATAWATVFVATPTLLEPGQGGWMAPALLIAAGLRLVDGWRTVSCENDRWKPAPPTRQVRGTLSLEGLVLADEEGLPRTVPMDLEVRAGESVAVVCDNSSDIQALADTLSGRRKPREGEVSVDGVPLRSDERLVAVVGPGEGFVAGSLGTNLEALVDGPLSAGQNAAVREACSLDEVGEALGGNRVAPDGAPLQPLHRLLVLAARVIPSQYKILVVLDPMPWVNKIHGEVWRTAVVRASVGRTAVWLTADRDLARRSEGIYELRHGGLRSMTLDDEGGCV